MKHKGFSLAEILITLVILGFVGALSVPMIGQQKLKKPNIFARQGLFECYYDADGQLKQHFVNNTDHKQDEYKVVNGDSCSFSLPSNINFFTLQVIGAGGVGGVGGSTNTRYNSIVIKDKDGENRVDSGSVSVDNDFQESLAKAPNWVKVYWDQQWAKGAKRPTYTISAAGGKGGFGGCHYARRNTEPCAKENQMPPNDQSCMIWDGANGGRGGDGVKYIITLPIYSSYVISRTATSISFGNGMSASVTPGSNGTNASNGKPYTAGNRGADGGGTVSDSLAPYATRLTNYGGSGGNGGCCERETSNPHSCTGGSGGTNGSSVSMPIRYEGEIPGIEAYYGKAGEAGKSIMKVYEKLPVSSLKLTPARSQVGGADTTVYYQKKDEEGYKILLKISASADGEQVAGDSIKIQDDKNTDFPFPNKRYPHEFAPKNPAIEVAKTDFNSKVADLMKNDATRPGRSGAGSYPIIGKVDHPLRLILNNIPFVSSNLIDYSSDATTFKCPYGAAKAMNSSGQYYCKETLGNPGAIVISW